MIDILLQGLDIKKLFNTCLFYANEGKDILQVCFILFLVQLKLVWMKFCRITFVLLLCIVFCEKIDCSTRL